MFFFYRAVFIINSREHSGIFWAASTDCLSGLVLAATRANYHEYKRLTQFVLG